MKSIFDHKQYDIMFEDGGIYIRPTLLKREINGIDWSIYPIINYGQDYHERDFDISLIEDNVDTENYRFVHYCTYKVYEYREGSAYITKKRKIIKDLRTTEKMEFDDFCNLIKKDEKYISI